MRRLAVLFLSALLLGAACGDDSGGGSAAASSASNTGAATTPAAAGSTAAPATTAAPDLGTLKVAVLPQSSFGSLYLAQEWGLFKEHGLTLDVTELTQSPDVISAGVSGSVDLISTGIEQAAVINESDAGKKFQDISAGITKSAFAVLYRPGLNVKPGDFSTLKGLKIGTFGAPRPGDTALRYELQQAGLDPDKDVTLVTYPVGPPGIQAWESKAFDVGIFAETNITALTDKGEALVFADLRDGSFGAVSNVPQSGYAAPVDRIATNRPQYEAFVSAICEAGKRATADPQAAAKILAPILSGGTGDTTLIEKAILHDIGNYGAAIDESALTQWLQLVNSTGTLKTMPAYDTVVDTSFAPQWEC